MQFLTEQHTLIRKIISYLKKDLVESSINDLDSQNREIVIKQFEDSKGECVGLATLWLYGKWLEDQDYTKEPKDDINNIRKIVNALTTWDEKSAFDPAIKIEIDRFIANLSLYQGHNGFLFDDQEKQLDLAVTLNDTHNRVPLDKFSQSIITDQKGLEDMLSSTIHPGDIIFISLDDVVDINNNELFEGHQMAIYQSIKEPNRIYFYDPNTGEREVNGIAQLAAAYFGVTKSYIYNSAPKLKIGWFGNICAPYSQLRNIDLQIFTFNRMDHVIQRFENNRDSIKNNINIISQSLENPLTRKFVLSLNTDELIGLLEDQTFDQNAKESLVKCIDAELSQIPINRIDVSINPRLINYLLSNYKYLLSLIVQQRFNNVLDSKNNKLIDEITDLIYDISSNEQDIRLIEKKAKLLTEQALEVKETLDFPARIYLLRINVGNSDLTKELLDDQNLKFHFNHVSLEAFFYFSLSELIKSNIESNNIDTAKIILRIFADKFSVVPTVENLVEYANQEIAEFMLKKYPNSYPNKSLQDISIKIKQNNKLKLMEEIKDLIDDYDSQEKSSHLEFSLLNKKAKLLTEKAQQMTELLSVEDRILLLTINIGNTELAEKLLNEAGLHLSLDDNIYKKGFFYLSVNELIKSNVESNNIDTAKTILRIFADKFDVVPNVEHLVEYANQEIAEFMLKKYPNSYPNKSLQDISIKIKQNNKLKLMEEIKDLIDDYDSEEKSNHLKFSLLNKKAKLLTKKAQQMTELLSVEDRILLLTINIGNTELAEKLLNEAGLHLGLDDNKYKKGFFYLSVNELIKSNVESNNIDTAKTILRIFADKFDVVPTVEHLVEYANQEIFEFMKDKYPNDYKQSFTKAGSPKK